MSLKQSAASGIKWSSVSQIGRQVMQLTTTVVLARLLDPSDFGLVGMATVIIGFVGIFRDLGTATAVIREKNVSEELLHSIFWLNTLLGLLVTTILFGVSHLAASFYQEPRVNPILKALSFTFLISGLGSVHQTTLERNLEFNKLAKVEIIATMLGSISGIGAAYLGLGVWSLICQTITITLVTTILLWLSSGWKPEFIINWKEVKSVSSYSLNLTGFNIINYFIRNADYLLIGRFLGAQSLGYYTLAYRIMLYPLQNIAGVIGRVVFPIFSQMQSDNARFRYAYIRVTGAIALITFPLMIGLWGLAQPLVLTVFGSSWNPVIQLLLIFAPVGMVQSLGTTVGVIYQVKGRTDWMFRWGIFAGFMILPAFAIGLQWGIIGVAAAYALVSAILACPNFAIPFKLIGLTLKDFYGSLWRSTVCSLLMLAGISGLRLLLPEQLASGWILGILVPIGVIIYGLSSWLINREQIRQVLSFAGVIA